MSPLQYIKHNNEYHKLVEFKTYFNYLIACVFYQVYQYSDIYDSFDSRVNDAICISLEIVKSACYCHTTIWWQVCNPNFVSFKHIIGIQRYESVLKQQREFYNSSILRKWTICMLVWNHYMNDEICRDRNDSYETVDQIIIKNIFRRRYRSSFQEQIHDVLKCNYLNASSRQTQKLLKKDNYWKKTYRFDNINTFWLGHVFAEFTSSDLFYQQINRRWSWTLTSHCIPMDVTRDHFV